MNRRSLLAALASSPTTSALAEHGWESYDTAQPLYLEGPVTTIIWADPHAHLEMLHRPSSAVVPADLRRRPMPRQKENVDVGALLEIAAVPAVSGVWRVELPSLARLSKWDVPRPMIKQVVSLLGYLGPQLLDTKTIQAEVFFVDGKAYPLRSDPA